MSQSSEELSDMENEAQTARSKETVKETPDMEGESAKKSEDDSDSIDGSDSDSDFSDSEYVCDVCNKKFSGFIPLKQHEKGSKHAKAVLKKKREKKLLDKIKGAEEGIELDEDHFSFIKKPFAVCKPCGKQFGDADSYHAHLVSKSHKQKKIQSSILDQVRDNDEINVDKLKELLKSKKSGDDADLLEDTEDKDAYEFECTDCEKSFCGLIPYTDHLMSKTHARKVEKKKLLEKLVPDTPEDLEHSTKPKSKDMSSLALEDDVLVCKLCSTSFSGPESAMIHIKSKKHAKKLDEQIRKLKRKQKTAEGAAAAKDSSGEDSDEESENKSDSDDEGEVEDKKSSKATDHTDQKASAAENIGEEKEQSNIKDNELLASERYKDYKQIMKQINHQDKCT